MSMKRLSAAIAAVTIMLLFGFVSGAKANSVTFTFNGMVGGEPAAATATFTVGAGGQLTIQLSNNIANIHDAGQLLVGLSFGFSNGTGSPSLVSELGNSINVGASGVVTSNGAVNPGWGFASNSSLVLFADIAQTVGGLSTKGSSVPALTLLGPPCGGGTYCAADGSIANNPAHNPFLNGPLTLVVTIPGLTNANQIGNVNFYFSTASGVSGPGTMVTPEPASLILLGTGLLGLGAGLRRRLGV